MEEIQVEILSAKVPTSILKRCCSAGDPPVSLCACEAFAEALPEAEFGRAAQSGSHNSSWKRWLRGLKRTPNPFYHCFIYIEISFLFIF